MKKENLVILLLRWGLAFVFLYAGMSIFTNPTSWLGFVPSFFDFIVSRQTILYLHAGFDVLIGVWLLMKRGLFYASILSTLNLFGIIIFNIGSFDIIFRDIGLLFVSLALVILSYPDQKKQGKK